MRRPSRVHPYPSVVLQFSVAIVDLPSRRATLASAAVAPSTLPVGTPASLLEPLTSPETAVEAFAIRLDSPARAATKSSHPITITLASAPAAVVMEESLVWAAVAADPASITKRAMLNILIFL